MEAAAAAVGCPAFTNAASIIAGADAAVAAAAGCPVAGHASAGSGPGHAADKAHGEAGGPQELGPQPHVDVRSARNSIELLSGASNAVDGGAGSGPGSGSGAQEGSKKERPKVKLSQLARALGPAIIKAQTSQAAAAGQGGAGPGSGGAPPKALNPKNLTRGEKLEMLLSLLKPEDGAAAAGGGGAGSSSGGGPQQQGPSQQEREEQDRRDRQQAHAAQLRQGLAAVGGLEASGPGSNSGPRSARGGEAGSGPSNAQLLAAQERSRAAAMVGGAMNWMVGRRPAPPESDTDEGSSYLPDDSDDDFPMSDASSQCPTPHGGLTLTLTDVDFGWWPLLLCGACGSRRP